MRKEDQEKWDRKLWVQLGHVKFWVLEEQSKKKSNKKVEIYIFDPSCLCVVDDALNEWHHQMWSVRCKMIIKNISGRLTIKGWTKKEEASPGRVENHRSQRREIHRGQSKSTMSNVIERSSEIKPEKCPSDSEQV